jgi:hypothetical protein
MTMESPTYVQPKLERYGSFRELTQVSFGLGAFALNPNVLSGSVASCDCAPTSVNPPQRS